MERAKLLYDWAKINIENKNSNIMLDYASNEEYIEVLVKLKKRFENLKSVPGTQKLHQINATSKHNYVEAKYYSLCALSEIKFFKLC